MTTWQDTAPPMAPERLFGGRRVQAYARRPAGLHAMLQAAVATRPDHEALVCGSERLTWAQLDARAAALAGGLSRAGVGPGDRIALLAGNGVPFVLTVFAAARLGAILVPVNIREQKPELTFLLAQCAARAILYDEAFAANLPDPEAAPALTLRVAIDSPRYEALLAGAPPPASPSGEQDTAILLYTSGTTGRPKGAMIANINLVHSALNYVACMDLGEDDRGVAAVPLSHVTGLVALLAALTAARACVILMEAFRAADFLALAEAEAMTHTVMVPAMYNLCLLQPDFARRDLKAWRIAGYGGSPMPLPAIERLAQALPGLKLMNLYGATETTSPATILPADQALARRDTVGRPVPGAEIRVMDEDGRETPTGETGEIWIRGPMVVPGYWDNPAATASEFTPAGDWKSGDLGALDADGYLRVLDRKKDMVNRGGYKIYSAEVESVLAAHPAVLESAIIGRPCPVLGERVHAAVTLKPDAPDTTPADLAAFVAPHLADYKRPETWTISREPLPRNANGKVLKRVLKEAVG